MTYSNCRKLLFSICVSLTLTLTLALTSPVVAIQNIGFPDDQSLVVNRSDLAQFQVAQNAMHEALKALIKYDGVDGTSKDRNAELKLVSGNAKIIQAIAKRAGNGDISKFMTTLKNWSTSGDADDREPKLIKKIIANLLALKVKSK